MHMAGDEYSCIRFVSKSIAYALLTLAYARRCCLRQFLRQLTRTLRAHAFWKVPYANAYAKLMRSLRPQCFLMVLTQVLPRGLRLPYAAMAPPYARMFCLRQSLRAAYATPTPLHF